jgi:hypothetical protein
MSPCFPSSPRKVGDRHFIATPIDSSLPAKIDQLPSAHVTAGKPLRDRLVIVKPLAERLHTPVPLADSNTVLTSNLRKGVTPLVTAPNHSSTPSPTASHK